jgi:asparagine synthase (glutamine-hydrolysing)
VGSLSQYAGYAVARLTRQNGVPVTLNGQGGDEVLSGYWECYFVYLHRLMREGQYLTAGTHVAGSLLPGGNPELARQAPRALQRFLARRAAPLETRGPFDRARALTPQQWRVYEIRELMLPRLLKWDDRNFMAFSVEGRYPFLDHHLIELCLSFAPHLLYARGWTKQPLRRGLERLLPASIRRRRTKLGFETPQDSWLAGPLASLVDDVVKGDSPAWSYTEPLRARTLAARVRTSRGGSREENQDLFRVVLLDRWLRRFELA